MHINSYSICVKNPECVHSFAYVGPKSLSVKASERQADSADTWKGVSCVLFLFWLATFLCVAFFNLYFCLYVLVICKLMKSKY